MILKTVWGNKIVLRSQSLESPHKRHNHPRLPAYLRNYPSINKMVASFAASRTGSSNHPTVPDEGDNPKTEEQTEGALTFSRNIGSLVYDLRCPYGMFLLLGCLDSLNLINLLTSFETQLEPTYTGLAALCVVLNSLSGGGYHQTTFNISLESIKKDGITFGALANLAGDAGFKVDAYLASQLTIAEFRGHLLRCNDECYLLVSYDRNKIEQSGRGHFAPIGRYHLKHDMVLILDVARYEYFSHWIPVSVLWEAMNVTDAATGLSRGFMVVSNIGASPTMSNQFALRGLYGHVKSPLFAASGPWYSSISKSICGKKIMMDDQLGKEEKHPVQMSTLKLSHPAISILSTEGLKLLNESLSSATSVAWVNLSFLQETQSAPGMLHSGLATLCNIINALDIDLKTRIGPRRWFDEQMIYLYEPPEQLGKQGMTLRKFCSLAQRAGAFAYSFSVADATIEEFRSQLLNSSSPGHCYMAVFYQRQLFIEGGGAHFSPIGGYNLRDEFVLLLDVERNVCPHHWVPLSLLWEAMKAIGDSGGP